MIHRSVQVLVWAAILAADATAQQPATPPSVRSAAAGSLKDKTDQELVELITGQKMSPASDSEGAVREQIKPSLLDRLWEMPPAEAAFAMVTDRLRDKSPLKIDDPKLQPPQKGEIGLRWVRGGHYMPVSHGVTILKYDGFESQLLLSEVEIRGQASADEIEAAVKKTDPHPQRRLVARQTFEILWWLGHVRFQDKTEGSGWEEISTFKDLPTRFWIEPGGIVVEGFIETDDQPCGECLAAGNKAAYAEFAAMLLDRLIKRSGIQSRYPMPTVGRYIAEDDDAKFLMTPPPDPGEATELKRWIGRVAEILRNPKRQYLHDEIMDVLVPISDPLRYHDPQIDDALLVVMHNGLAASSKSKELENSQVSDKETEIEIDDDSTDPAKVAKAKERDAQREQRRNEERQLRDTAFDGMKAAEKLGFHDAVAAFSELLELAKQINYGRFEADNRPLIAAASIAGRHPDLRPQLAKYLADKLSTDGGNTRGTPFLEAVWRGDLREVTPTLEKLADLPRPAPNPGDVRESAVEKASLILTAWRESDPLTKTKIDTLLSSVIGGGNSIPDVLRVEFETLSSEEKSNFRQFITWMRTAGASVQLRYLENTFTPHTPRPDNWFER